MALFFSFYNVPLYVSKKGNEIISLASSVFNIILKEKDGKVYHKKRGVPWMVGREDYLFMEYKN
jgi:hypothetical protein